MHFELAYCQTAMTTTVTMTATAKLLLIINDKHDFPDLPNVLVFIVQLVFVSLSPLNSYPISKTTTTTTKAIFFLCSLLIYDIPTDTHYRNV